MGKTVREWENIFSEYSEETLDRLRASIRILQANDEIRHEFEWTGIFQLGYIAEVEMVKKSEAYTAFQVGVAETLQDQYMGDQ